MRAVARITRNEKIFNVGLAASILCLGLVVPIFVQSRYVLHLLIMSMIWGVVALSWNILVMVGVYNLGQIAFMGVGAYSSALISMNLNMSPWVCMVAGGLFAAVSSAMIGVAILRLKGAYIAMLTLAVSEMTYFLDSNLESLTRGEMGLWGIPPLFNTSEKIPYYYVILIILFLSALLQYLLTKSRYGLAATAIKESERAAQSLGVNISRFKVMAFFVSAFLTGIVGAFYAHYILLLSPSLLVFGNMVDVTAMGILGGIGTIVGPIIGAFIITFFLEFFRFIGEYRFLIYGFLLIIIILFKPQGIYAGFAEVIKRINWRQEFRKTL